MADTGAPGFIPLASGSDQFSPPQAPLNALATALNTALSKTAFTTYATQALLYAAPGTVIGQHASVNADTTTANNGDYRWSGSAWVQTAIAGGLFAPYAVAAGSGSNAAAAYGTITFPAGRFTQPPLVFGKTKGANVAIFNTNTITTTTAQAGGFNLSNSAIACSWDWFAIQMFPGAAAG